MRIAILSRNFDVRGGGAERYACEIARHLALRHEVHVFAQSFGEALPGVFYHPLSFSVRRPRWINQLGFALESWLRTRSGYDIVHAHENTWHGQIQTVHVMPVRFSLLSGRTGWQRYLRYLKVGLSPRISAYLWLEKCRFSLMPGRRVVAVSQSLSRNIEVAYPCLQRHVQTITPGVDLPAEPSPAMQAAARGHLRLPLKRRIALFVANDPRRKGLDFLLQALTLSSPDWCLAVVGESQQYPNYHQKALSMGLADRFFLLGSQKNMSEAYFAADILIHPTLEDTFAMVVLEAMAHRLPVMVSGPLHCGISEMLTHEKQALILDDPTDPQAIAQGLMRLDDSAHLMDSIRTGGWIFAKQHAWSDVADAYDQLFQVCAKGDMKATK